MNIKASIKAREYSSHTLKLQHSSLHHYLKLRRAMATGNESLQLAASMKALMMKESTDGNLNLYDHLTSLLMKVVDEQPQNVVGVIEEMSHDVKRGLFLDKQSTLRDLPQTTAAELLAEQQLLLFTQPEEDDEEEKLMETSLPNVSEICFYLEQAGVGLGREETQRIFLALKQLVESKTFLRCRLWGKIVGTESNYIVAEVEEEEAEEEAEEETEKNEMDSRESTPNLMEVPMEAPGTGANKYVYYVCKEPGLPWVKLPSVSPAQIIVARQIRKFLTGKLDAPVVSYPLFPGNEANYLRAQIARISAGTQVSPQGFFLVGEEEGDEDDEAPCDTYEVNPEFEGISVAGMVESLSGWVHHVQHILKQGRCTWVNPAVKPAEDADEEEESEEKEEDPDEPEPEVGPYPLTPLTEDAELFNTLPWTSRVSSTLTSQHAVAVLHSNLWPGAHAFAYKKKFENIYVGWGLKYSGDGYSPLVPPPPQEDYPSGPEITEILDPTLEEEQALQDDLDEEEEAKEEEDTDEEDEDEDEEDED